MLNPSDGKPARRLAPESKELLLFKSAGEVSLRVGLWRRRPIPAMFVTFFSCGVLLLELENKGTGGRWRDRGDWNSVVDDGAELA